MSKQYSEGTSPFLWSVALDQVVGKGHDRWLVEGAFAGVADGATPLGEEWPDAGEFASFALKALASNQDVEPIQQQWAQAVAPAIAQYGDGGYKRSCGIASARISRGDFEVSSVGDCGVVVQLKSQEIHVQVNPRLSALDAGARGRSDELDVLLRNRKRLNTPEGYWVFSPTAAMIDHVESTRWPVGDVELVLLFSDGVSRLIDPLKAFDWSGLVANVRAGGPDGLIRHLRNLEATHSPAGDSLLERPDDAVVLVIQP